MNNCIVYNMMFYDASISEVTGVRNKLFLMIMMVSDIRGWMGPTFS